MAAEDLPSEFDVVILGTGTDSPAGFYHRSDPDHRSEYVPVRSGFSWVQNTPESRVKPVRTGTQAGLSLGVSWRLTARSF